MSRPVFLKLLKEQSMNPGKKLHQIHGPLIRLLGYIITIGFVMKVNQNNQSKFAAVFPCLPQFLVLNNLHYTKFSI